MNIVIVSGQYNVEILPTFDNLVSEYGGCDPIYFPERLEKYYHPNRRYNDFKKKFIECIESGKDIVISTYCDYIFNAARVVKHKYPENVNLIVYQLDTDGNDNRCEVCSMGRVPNWVDGIFDTFDISLDELLDLD